MLGDAQTVVDAGRAALGVEPGRPADFRRVETGEGLLALRGVPLIGDEPGPGLELGEVAALADIGLVDQPLGDDHVRQRVDEGDVGAGLQRQVIVGLDVGRLHEVDLARIGDDQLGALTQALLHPRAEDRVAVGGIGADHQDHVGMLHRLEVLCAGRGAQRRHQAVAGRRVADAGAGIDVVVAEGGAHELLDEVGLLVGAARRGDAADRILAVLGLDPLELGGRPVDGLLPGDLAPRIRDLLADHRLGDAVLVGGVAVGEAALHAAMALIGLAALVGDHADDALALHLGLERAADAAIGAGRHFRVLGLAEFVDRFFLQRRRGTRLNAGATRDALGFEKIGRAGRHAAVEAAARDGQREGALHLFAGAHAAVADDALRRVVGEVRVRLVLRQILLGARLDVVVAVIAIADVPQADDAGLRLQLAIAVGRAGQAVQRVIGDVELHHALAELGELLVLRVHHHAVLGRGRAGGRGAAAALDLHEAEAAGAERLQAIGGAELRDLRPGMHRRRHHRGARRHRHRHAVDRQRDGLFRHADRRAVVDLLDQAHRRLLTRPRPADRRRA